MTTAPFMILVAFSLQYGGFYSNVFKTKEAGSHFGQRILNRYGNQSTTFKRNVSFGRNCRNNVKFGSKNTKLN